MAFIPPLLTTWLDRHKERLMDAGWLALALNAPKLCLGLPRTPWLAQFALLAAFALLAPPKAHLIPDTWPRYRKLLPSYLATAAVGLTGFILWFDLPWHHCWFAPIWFGLTLVARLPVSAYGRAFAAWLGARRYEVLGGDALLLIFFSWATPRWSQQSGPAWWAIALLFAGWGWLHRHGCAIDAKLWRLPGLAAAWGALWLANDASALPAALVFSTWLALSLAAYRAAVHRWAATPQTGFGEVLRWLGLGGLVVLFFHPFFRAGVHGSGDAHYYATFLADALEQFRHGVFPVYVGQSEYQFNGSVIPIRIAPAFQYAGGFADVLTWRLLNPMALQNLLVTAAGLGAVGGTYACLRWLRVPGREAWLLAVLYLTCPGVMGLAFNTDLYMSWLTAPLVSVAFALTLRSWTTPAAWLTGALGFVVGLAWWAHTPIALWLTVLMMFLQLGRLWRPKSSWFELIRAFAAGAVAFGATAAYPLVSAVLHPADPDLGAGGGFVVPANHVLQQLLETFPAAWLPMSDLGRRLTDYQLGYGLLGVGLLLAPAAWRSGRRELRALLIAAILLLLLLVPVPWLNLKLWQLVPDAVRTVTNIWVMQRLYVLLAATLVMMTALTWSAGRPARASMWLTVACLWSLTEAIKFVHGSAATVTPLSASPERLAPENIVLTRYSYGLFRRKPVYFTHGTTDPVLENRLLADDLQTLVDGNYTAAMRTAGPAADHRFAVVEGHIEIENQLELAPGRRYLLRLTMGPSPPGGTLVLQGRRLQRVYGLPEYGEAQSFGLGGAHNPCLPLHTSGSTPESVRVLFEPSAPVDLAALAGQAALRLQEYSPANLPVRMRSWIPYQAVVRSPVAAWLETPRMYQAGYHATVNGQPAELKRTAEGLTGVRVPAGESEVVLRYAAPIRLALAFWLSLLTLAAGLLAAVAMLFRLLREPPAAGATPAAAFP